eukprot:scaffold77515_cov42-Phaeocystis_antarctica.AAC.1
MPGPRHPCQAHGPSASSPSCPSWASSSRHTPRPTRRSSTSCSSTAPTTRASATLDAPLPCAQLAAAAR